MIVVWRWPIEYAAATLGTRGRIAAYAVLTLVVAVLVAACGQPKSISVKTVAKLSATSTPVIGTRSAPGLPAFQGGVIAYADGNDPSALSSANRLLDHLVAVKVNTVALAFPLYQTSWTSTDVHTDPAKTPNNDFIAGFIDSAHQRDLAVLLRPLIDDTPLEATGHWRGQLQPTNPGAWFASYKQILLGYSAIAAAHHAEVIDIGTELNSLQGNTGAWTDLITAMRGAYQGKLTYSSNWDVAYPAFASSLDFVSVDAFYPLNAPDNASVAQLVSAWSPWVSKLQQVGSSTGKSVVLTELGTTSETGSYRSPYNWKHDSGVNLEAQRLYYAASCQALKPLVGGMYWWVYYLNYFDKTVPATDTSYQPAGKPAEQEITNCYR